MNFHQKTQQQKLPGTNGLKKKTNSIFSTYIVFLPDLRIYFWINAVKACACLRSNVKRIGVIFLKRLNDRQHHFVVINDEPC